MTTVKRCCCCCPLMFGILLWAYLRLIGTIVFLGLSVTLTWALMAFASEDYEIRLMMVAILLAIIDVIFNVILIIGCHKESTSMLQVYYRCGIAYAIAYVVTTHSWIIYFTATKWRDLKSRGRKNLAIMESVIIMVLIQHMYLLVLTHSQIVKLTSTRHCRCVNHTAVHACPLRAPCAAGDVEKSGARLL